MEYPILLGVLLLTASGAAIVCDLYAVQGNYKSLINRLFLIICGSMFIWSLGLAIAAAAANAPACMIGRRLAPVGWGSMFAFLLHFVMLLTGYDKPLKKWWFSVLLYLPGAVTVFAFTILPLIGHNPDVLVLTGLGWISISEIDVWDWLYYIYFLGYMAVALILLWKWKKRAASANIKKQAKLIIGTFFLATAFGTMTDVMPVFLSTPMPQIATAFILLPIAAVSYSVKRYGFLRPEIRNQNEIILNKATRRDVYRSMGLIFAICSLLNILANCVFCDSAAAPGVFGFSGVLAGYSMFFLVIDRMKLDGKLRELLAALSFAFIVPWTVLMFTGCGGMTIWALVFLLIIICLLFNRRMMLISIIVPSVTAQLFVWAASPSVDVRLDGSDYMARVVLLVLGAFLAFYVNGVYVNKLKENAHQISLQKLVSDVSYDFVSVNASNLDQKLYAMLRMCASFMQIDSARVVLLDAAQGSLTYACEWRRKGPARPGQEPLLLPLYAQWLGQLKTHNMVEIPDTRHPGTENEALERQNIRALLILPVKAQEAVAGFLGFTSSTPRPRWDPASLDGFGIIANIVSDALIKINTEKEIRYMAYHDQLTKLPNRVFLHDRLRQAIKLAGRAGNMVGVVFIDLDAFKAVNDTMGHDLGDKILVKVAQHLTKRLRDSDTVCRFGGDEFVIMLNSVSATRDIIKIVDQLMGIFNKPFVLKGQEFFVTASAGIALYPKDGTDAESLIKNADIAMYNAKLQGKNQYVLCSEDMKDDVLERMKLIKLLPHAQENDQLILHYQPQIDLESQKIIGLEALIRWNLPDIGMLSPAAFIPLAEQAGLINSIGEWALRTACRQNRVWQDMGLPKLRMAVNISVNQLRNPGFISQIGRILGETGLAPAYLELEITEKVASNHTENIIGVLTDLKELGVSISIDDFGTEYSSLGRLKLLPIDRIKMDMQFVHGIGGDGKDQAITKIIINLAKGLGLKVLAEGVETAPQLAFLNRKMCDEVQGYYYYKPMTAGETERVLRNGVGI